MGASLNQPSSVKDEGSMGRKLLLYGNKVFHVWNFVCTIFFNDTATTEIYTLSLHDALPIYGLIIKEFRLSMGMRSIRQLVG